MRRPAGRSDRRLSRLACVALVAVSTTSCGANGDAGPAPATGVAARSAQAPASTPAVAAQPPVLEAESAEPPPHPPLLAVPGLPNRLRNPGFELGREGWTSMGTRNWGAFEIVPQPVRSGFQAAHLEVASAAGAPRAPVKVFGVVQELRPQDLDRGFPDRLSGSWRVESWEKGNPATSLYLQVVVIVWGDPRAPELVSPGQPDSRITNYQIRFYLAGIEEPPFLLRNAKVRFVGKGPPALGTWVPFEIDVEKEFQELWGVVPQDFEFIRVLFEGRWDNNPPGAPLHADVYYDDLFFGYTGDFGSTGD